MPSPTTLASTVPPSPNTHCRGRSCRPQHPLTITRVPPWIEPNDGETISTDTMVCLIYSNFTPSGTSFARPARSSKFTVSDACQRGTTHATLSPSTGAAFTVTLPNQQCIAMLGLVFVNVTITFPPPATSDRLGTRETICANDCDT